MGMRTSFVLIVVAAVLTLCGCSQYEAPAQQHHEANTVAGKVGQAAHRAAVATDKAGHAVGRQLEHAAHDAHEGWKEDAQRTRDRK